jgi:hypothetical protein
MAELPSFLLYSHIESKKLENMSLTVNDGKTKHPFISQPLPDRGISLQAAVH